MINACPSRWYRAGAQKIKSRSLLAVITAVVLTCMLLTLPGLAFGGSLQQQINDVGSQIDSKKQLQNQTQTQADTLNKQLQDVVVQYQSAYSELSQTETDITKNQRRLSSAIEQQSYYQVILNNRSVSAYRYGNIYYLEVLMDTKDFQDFLVRLDFLAKVSERDAQVLAASKTLKNEIASDRNLLEKQKSSQRVLVNLMANKQDEMNKTLASQQQLLNSLQGDIKNLATDQQNLLVAKQQEDARLVSLASSGKSSSSSGGIDDNYAADGANPGSAKSNMIFPVARGYSHGYSNDWGGARPGGTFHQGTDIFGIRGTPIVAATNGVVGSMFGQQMLGGFRMWVLGDDGYNYYYAHLNGDVDIAYAPGIAPGVRVSQGQVIGYMGDSGQAKGTGVHLHFGITVTNPADNNWIWINPYPYLKAVDR